mmetsp:Transcript_338/g.1605  ORF Transcript_338/g.1605 Transcript_338/m.1605 type:complete len:215 (-) Transcript_338:1793-2437(-)
MYHLARRTRANDPFPKHLFARNLHRNLHRDLRRDLHRPADPPPSRTAPYTLTSPLFASARLHPNPASSSLNEPRANTAVGSNPTSPRLTQSPASLPTQVRISFPAEPSLTLYSDTARDRSPGVTTYTPPPSLFPLFKSIPQLALRVDSASRTESSAESNTKTARVIVFGFVVPARWCPVNSRNISNGALLWPLLFWCSASSKGAARARRSQSRT